MKSTRIWTSWLFAFATALFFTSYASAQEQIITGTPATQAATPSQAVSVDAVYSTNPPNTNSTGLAVRVHFNSSQLTFTSFTNKTTAPVQTDNTTPQADVTNADADPATDVFVTSSYLDFGGAFSGTQRTLFTANLTTTAGFTGTTVRFTRQFNVVGFTFSSTPAAITLSVPISTITVAATDPNAAEAGADTGTFTFTRTAPITAALTVTYTVSGTATSGTDYTALSGTVNFAAGSATATVTVTPIDDAAAEGSETVIVTIAAGAGYTVGAPASATVNIADNDGPPPPTPTAVTCPAGLFVGGPAGTATVTLSAAAPAGGQVVTLSSSAPGTATVPASATVPAGATSTTFSVTPGATAGSSTITATANSGNANCTVDVGAAPAVGIPALSGLGLSILIVLLAGVGVFLMGKIKM